MACPGADALIASTTGATAVSGRIALGTFNATAQSAYEACLAHELTLRGLNFERQKALPVSYKGVQLECGYRMDFVVCAELVVEIKAVQALLPVHEAQLISYLRLTRIPAGFLVNFHAETIRRGLRRLTLNPPNLPPSCDHAQKSC